MLTACFVDKLHAANYLHIENVNDVGLMMDVVYYQMNVKTSISDVIPKTKSLGSRRSAAAISRLFHACVRRCVDSAVSMI